MADNEAKWEAEYKKQRGFWFGLLEDFIMPTLRYVQFTAVLVGFISTFFFDFVGRFGFVGWIALFGIHFSAITYVMDYHLKGGYYKGRSEGYKDGADMVHNLMHKTFDPILNSLQDKPNKK